MNPERIQQAYGNNNEATSHYATQAQSSFHQEPLSNNNFYLQALCTLSMLSGGILIIIGLCSGNFLLFGVGTTVGFLGYSFFPKTQRIEQLQNSNEHIAAYGY